MMTNSLCGCQTPLALLSRARKNGGKEIREVLGNWKFWIPTKTGQASQVAALFILRSLQPALSCLYTHCAYAASVHVQVTTHAPKCIMLLAE